MIKQLSLKESPFSYDYISGKYKSAWSMRYQSNIIIINNHWIWRSEKDAIRQIYIDILKYSNMNVYEETANLYTPNNHIN